jgi:DNA-binding beta-propeller fold protein YncE
LIAVCVFGMTASAAVAAPGGFAQLGSPFGCLQNAPAAAGCTSVTNMQGPYRIAISPDGKNLYATSFNQHTIAIYDRNATTGRLTKKPGVQGCISNTGDGVTCADARFLSGPLGIVVTKNGQTVYVASDLANSVLAFTRNTTTGVLTQKANEAGCIADSGTVNECRDGRVLAQPFELALSPNDDFLYVTSFGSSAVSVIRLFGGEMLPVNGANGCLQSTATAEGCNTSPGLGNPWPITVSPNGSTVYAGGYFDNSIVAFQRNQTTGEISTLATNGCLDAQVTAGCTTSPDLSEVRDIVVSKNSARIYAVTNNRVVLFDRQANGGLVRRAGAGGCVSNGAAANCTTGRGLAMGEKAGLGLSPDGEHLYAAASGVGGGLTEQIVAANGSLTPRSGVRGCAVTGAPPAGCAEATEIAGPVHPVVSPDGKFIYVATRGDNSIGVFKRDTLAPVCQNVTVNVPAGQVTNVFLPCSDGDGDALSRQTLSPPALGILGAVNQANGTVPFASSGVAGTTSFTYRAFSNGVPSAPATLTLNVTGGGGVGSSQVDADGDGFPAGLDCVDSNPNIRPGLPEIKGNLIDENCDGRVEIDTITSPINNAWSFTRRTGKTFTAALLLVRNVPRGGRVEMRCSGRPRCKFNRITVRPRRGQANLKAKLRGAKGKFRAGQTLEIRISASGLNAKVVRYAFKKGRAPRGQTLCIPLGQTRAKRTC